MSNRPPQTGCHWMSRHLPAMLIASGGIMLLYVAARASVPPRPVQHYPPELDEAADFELPLMATTMQETAPAVREETAPASREPTPTEWKDLPETRKVEYLRKNYGARATADAAPPSSLRPPLPRAVATDDHHLRSPFNKAPVTESTPLIWKETPEDKKREFLERNYGAASFRREGAS